MATEYVPELIEGAPLRYAPNNEAGVVFLFSHVCKRMQIQVESIQAGFPDCIARQRVGGKERRIRIEFEYRSSNFRQHRHPADGCDWIVCWKHDWPGVPKNLEVIELQRFFGNEFNVWVCMGELLEQWPQREEYVFGRKVRKGDLVFFYERHPRQRIKHVYSVHSEGTLGALPGVRERFSHTHTLKKLCEFDPPISIRSLESKTLAPIRDAIFSQAHNRRVTDHWWLLHWYICKRFPHLSGKFKNFEPSRV